MIDRKDLKVGLVTEEGHKVSAIGAERLLYICDNNNVEFSTYIANFCSSHSIKKEKVEVVRWVNVYKNNVYYHKTERGAKTAARRYVIAVAVKLAGSYEV